MIALPATPEPQDGRQTRTAEDNCRWVREKIAERGWTEEIEAYAANLVNYAFATEASAWLARQGSAPDRLSLTP